MRDAYPRYFDSRRILPILPGWLPDDVARSESVVPIGRDGDSVIVAVLEACTDETLDKVRFTGNSEIRVAIVSEEAMAYALARYVTKS
jgi:hypothetical protein